MMWLAWRQFRAQAVILAGAVVVFAVIFGVTAPHLFHVYDTIVKSCTMHGDCNSTQGAFLNNYNFYEHLVQDSIIFPALLGAFLGAPLVAREYEHDTFRLAWTQSETRTKWFAAKICVAGIGGIVAIGLFSLMATLWSRPWDHVNNLPFSTFDTRDLVPVAYAAFAFALGVAAGAVLRRTVPAMAVTLFGYAAVHFFFSENVRPHFLAPLRFVSKYTLPFFSNGSVVVRATPQQSDWIVTDQLINKSGVVIGEHGGVGSNGNISFRNLGFDRASFEGVGRCPNKFPAPPARVGGGETIIHGGPSHAMLDAMQKCVASFQLRTIVTYQPVSRFWTFQWMEFGSFLVLTAVLFAFSLWWVRRH
jgi:hypothetical protein